MADPTERRGNAPRRRPRPEDEDPARKLARPLREVLDRLPAVERKVLEYRMGLVDGHPHPIGETAREVGVTLTEAKQIEERAFSRIREVVPLEHLQKFLGG